MSWYSDVTVHTVELYRATCRYCKSAATNGEPLDLGTYDRESDAAEAVERHVQLHVAAWHVDEHDPDAIPRLNLLED